MAITEILQNGQGTLVILQIRNSEKDSIILQQIYENRKTIPVIIVGRMESVHERIYWLEQEACDCISWECSWGEIIARENVVLRRCR